MSNSVRSGTCMQATLVGLIDNRAHYEQLLHACRAMSGKPEQHLLHKESVYKASPRLSHIAFSKTTPANMHWPSSHANPPSMPTRPHWHIFCSSFLF